MKTKKVTMEDLVILIKKSNKNLSKKIDNKIDGLALIVADSFEGMEERLTMNLTGKINSLGEKLTQKIDGVEERLSTKINATDRRIDHFAETKTSKIEHKKLISRVAFIEEKFEIVK